MSQRGETCSSYLQLNHTTRLNFESSLRQKNSPRKCDFLELKKKM